MTTDEAVSDGDPRWVRVVERITVLGVIGAGVATVLMGLNIVLDVFGRNVLATPLPGTLDVVTHLWMPALALLGLGYAELRNEQICVTLLVESGSSTTQRNIGVAVEVVTGVLVAWMTYLCVDALVHSVQIQESAIGTAWVKIWPGRAIVVVALVIFLISVPARIHRIWRGIEMHSEIEVDGGRTID